MRKQQQHYGKDEMNLAEFPFAKLNSRDDRSIIEYSGWYTDPEGNRNSQKWVVRSATGLGLPSELGERIVMALIAFTADQGFESPKVEFSIYQLLKALGVSRNKRQYTLIEQQLKKLVGITIDSENAFWDHEKKKRISTTTAFHLIEKVWLRHQEEGEIHKKANASYGYIVWSETVWNSFKAGYIKSLDLDFYYGLPKPLSRRLYRFLDKRMRYQDEYEIDIFDLANRLGCARYESPSQVKRVLQPAFEPLIENGFLADAAFFKYRKYTRVRFSKPVVDSESWAQMVIDAPVITNEPLSENDQLWQDTLAVIRLQVPKNTFNAWLKDTVVLARTRSQLIVGVKNSQAKEWLENRLIMSIERPIKDHFVGVTEIIFAVL